VVLINYLQPLMASPPRKFQREPLTLRRRLRQKLFVWRMAADAPARRALLLRQPATDAQGLLHLRLRGLPSPLILRPGPATDDRQTVWELFFHRPYDGLLPFDYRTVLDLGANVGLTLAYLIYRNAPIERYVGVEPDPETFAILARQVEALGMASRSRLFNVAAGDRDGVLRFHTSGQSIIHQVGETGDLEVPARTVGGLLDDAGLAEVDLMKLDIEGGERQVIADAPAWARRVKRIAAELHYDMDAGWLRKKLSPLGFRVFEEGVLFREAVGAVREDLADTLPAHLR
jgi:FkbM family methyltransferase